MTDASNLNPQTRDRSHATPRMAKGHIGHHASTLRRQACKGLTIIACLALAACGKKIAIWNPFDRSSPQPATTQPASAEPAVTQPADSSASAVTDPAGVSAATPPATAPVAESPSDSSIDPSATQPAADPGSIAPSDPSLPPATAPAGDPSSSSTPIDPLPMDPGPLNPQSKIATQPYDLAFYTRALPSPLPPVPQDAPHPEQIGFYLDVFSVQVPLGTLSQHEDFWKQLDEHALDVSTYDTMYRNGVRVGIANTAQWADLREIIAQAQASVSQSTLLGKTGSNSELSVRDNVTLQTIFQFTPQNGLVGRTYENSENLLTFAFTPTPRKFGSARVTVCPIVRSKRKRLDFIESGETRDVGYVSTERLYDINLRVDIPFSNFLIIAPSDQARIHTTMGNRFLVSDGPSSAMERVLLVVPHPYRLEPVQPGAAKPPEPSRSSSTPARPR